MNSCSVVVLGSLHYDIFIESLIIPQISETVLGKKWYPKLGGKGANQSKAIVKNGIKVKFISAIGNDNFGEFLYKELKKNKIQLKFIQKFKTNSGMSIAVSNSRGDYSAIVISGANLKISKSIFEKQEIWKNTKYLLLQNEIKDKINFFAAKEAKNRNVQVIFNAAPAKKINKDLKSLIDILIVNEIEAKQLTKIKNSNLKQISKILSKDFSCVIITAGSKGVTYCKNSNKPINLPSVKVNVKNTHGAGDYFIGTFCSSLILGNSIDNAINFANKMAAKFVSK